MSACATLRGPINAVTCEEVKKNTRSAINSRKFLVSMQNTQRIVKMVFVEDLPPFILRFLARFSQATYSRSGAFQIPSFRRIFFLVQDKEKVFAAMKAPSIWAIINRIVI